MPHPTPPPKEHHEAINDLNTILQRMKNQSYDMEGIAQDNTVLASSNSAVMAKLAQITATMNARQAQLKNLSATSTNPKIPNIKY